MGTCSMTTHVGERDKISEEMGSHPFYSHKSNVVGLVWLDFWPA
jgi:hypothetical protein